MKSFLRAFIFALIAALVLTPFAEDYVLRAQSAVAVPFLKSQWLDANGNPLVSGCLFTYSSGGTTPKVSYQTSSGSSGASNTNPVILDAGGKALVWLGSGNYRLDLYSAGGVNCASGALQWSIDNVPGFGTASGYVGGTGTAGECAYFSVTTTIASDAGCLYDSGTDSLTIAGAISAGTTLSVTGNVAVNTNRFNVTASNGNTAIAGTLAVTGALTGSSTAAFGTAGSVVGSISMANATSGTVTLAPTTGALGTVTATFPAANITVSGAKTYFCGTTNSCADTLLTPPIVIAGITAALDGASPAVAAVTGISPGFTSTTSYACSVANEGNAATTVELAVRNVSGTAFTVTATNGATNLVHYVCVGN
jgi:hypothetical protein